MRNLARILATFTIVLLAALTVQVASAATLEVGTCPIGRSDGHVSAYYSTIQAAVNAAAPGSKVLVCPGAYPEQVEINKPLTLKGVANGNTGAAVIVSPPGGLIVPPDGFTGGAPQIFAHDVAGEVNVSNLTVDAANNQITDCSSPNHIIGIYLLNAGGSIDNVVTRNQNTASGSNCFNGIGIRVYADTIPSAVTVSNVTSSTYDFAGIMAQAPLAKVMISNNSYVDMPGSGGGILLFDGLVATVSQNTVAGDPNAFAGIAVVGVQNAIITRNHIGNDPYGMTLYSFTGDPNSDANIISRNEVFGSGADGIAVCGDNNLIQGNSISGSTESAVNLVTGNNFFGTQCTSNNNRIAGNATNGACAGVLMDPAASGNVVSNDNTMFNVVNLQLTGTACLASTSAATKNLRAARGLPASHRLAAR